MWKVLYVPSLLPTYTVCAVHAAGAIHVWQVHPTEAVLSTVLSERARLIRLWGGLVVYSPVAICIHLEESSRSYHYRTVLLSGDDGQLASSERLACHVRASHRPMPACFNRTVTSLA